ncbi:MAG TPA: CbiQ family ECF transporter T component [Streptosporangiaceae bacterium]|nr:CbiQ family ECF transporter T component [Streptosporangiaceae bacterium]
MSQGTGSAGQDIGRAPPGRRPVRLPRALHPVAWWCWAIGLATAASRTSNPLLLVLILAVLGLVVALRRSAAPWARGYRFYLLMALVVIAIRVGFSVVFTTGASARDHILLTLPVVPMPSWYSGVRIGGPVSAEAVLSAAADGARLACLLCCIGAANTLANPKRALRVLPGALYELGVAVTVALSVAPQLVESVGRVRRARRLRGAAGPKSGGPKSGGPKSGRHRFGLLRGVAIPVLHDALDRSLRLAAAMDARGYGRTGTATAASRRLTAACLLAGLAGLCLGGYELLDPTVPPAVGVGGFTAGTALAVAGLVLGGRRVSRSRYRPDPWRWPEWVVAASGLACAVVLWANVGYDPAALNPAFYPLHWPSLPVLPAVAILVTAVAAVAAPPVPVPAASAAPGTRPAQAALEPAAGVSQ